MQSIINFLTFSAFYFRKKVNYHGSCWASLHEYVDAADLPEDYGGFQDRLDRSQWADEIVSSATDETCNVFDLN